jgi:hypothetical protein
MIPFFRHIVAFLEAIYKQQAKKRCRMEASQEDFVNRVINGVRQDFEDAGVSLDVSLLRGTLVRPLRKNRISHLAE